MKRIIAVFLCTVIFLSLGVLVCSATDGEADTVEKVNLFSALYDAAIEYSAEILSALAFVGSLIIAFTYKKGLLPLIKGALGALGNLVSSIRESTEAEMEISSGVAEEVKERLLATEKLIEGLVNEIIALEARLASKDEAEREAVRARTVVAAQVDMLYEIFMTSSLPQYAKDRVGERIAAMKAELAISDEGER